MGSGVTLKFTCWGPDPSASECDLVRMGSLQAGLVKVRSHWSRAALMQQHDWCPYEMGKFSRRHRRAQGRRPGDGGGRDGVMSLQAEDLQTTRTGVGGHGAD